MKKMKGFLCVIGLFSIQGLVSCGKEMSATMPVKTNTELLTQKSWKFVAQGLDENNNGIIEASESDILPCQVDDVLVFRTDGTGLYMIGRIPCPPQDVSINFNWHFSNGETELAIFAYPEKIKRLDDAVLETYYDNKNAFGQPVKYIKIYAH